MNIKLDENLPARLALVLGQLGHDADTVKDEGLDGRDDPTIWNVAQREKRFLVTQDLDFSDMREFMPGTHAGILLIRLQTPGLSALIAKVEELFQCEDVDNWKGCLVIATERKLRIKRPSGDGQTGEITGHP